MHAHPPLRGPALPAGFLQTVLPLMRGLAADSRRVEPGMGFAAFPGESGDGRRWIGDALDRGASALLWEPDNYTPAGDWRVPSLAVPALRDHASWIAAQVYGDPSAQLQVIGVTGTNGKTSCTHWLAQALGAAGRPCGVVGTLGSGMPGALQATGYTTPGPVELQQQLDHLRRQGALAVAMEVSSHGLAQGRVHGVHFDLALFTNLTRDHLDYHGSMEAYGAAKAALFRAAGLRCAILNLDDPFGAALHAELAAQGHAVLGYTQSATLPAAGAVVRAHAVRFSPDGIAFELEAPQGRIALETHLVGAFNLSNVLGVAACLLESGIEPAQLGAHVAALEAPPGRMQRLGGSGQPLVVVDYAHTPDALEQVLRALRASLETGGRLICVFGCGGDRDSGKRPLMGRIAEAGADTVIVTSDNPRSEDPAVILDAIAAGMTQPPHAALVERAAAIALAIDLARPGDIVLIAGKGHETTQDIGGHKLPFSDIAVARACLVGTRGAA